MKLMFSSVFLSLFIVFVIFEIKAMEKLSYEDAVSIALKNNFGISILKNEVKIAENNNSLGNSGFLPEVDLNASLQKNINNTKQEYLDGRVVDKSGAVSNSYNAGIILNQTLFDGGIMFINKEKMNEMKNLSELELTKKIEEVISAIFDVYYSIVKQSYVINYLKESLQISEERLKLAELKYNVGKTSKLNYLQALTDFNEDKSEFLNQSLNERNLKVQLNRILARDVNAEFIVEESIKDNGQLNYEELKKKALNNNINIKLVEQSKLINSFNTKIAKGKIFPKIGLFAGYNFLQSNSEAGFLKTNTQLGFNYGLNLNFNIFNGFNTGREIENAEILDEITYYNLMEARIKTESEFLSTYNSYNFFKEQTKLEQSNVEINRENLDIAREELNVGTITSLEFREIQKKYLSAMNRLISTKLNVLLFEKELKKLSGELILN